MDLPSFMYLLYFGLGVVIVYVLARIGNALNYHNKLKSAELLLQSKTDTYRERGERLMIEIYNRA